MLEEHHQLFALIVMGADRTESSIASATAIENWVAQLADQRINQIKVQLITDRSLMPKDETICTSEVPDGDRWAELRAALKTCLAFSVSCQAGKAIFDVNTFVPQSGSEEPAPQLAFFFDTNVLDATELDAAESCLFAVANDLMITARGMQAFMGRWAWRGLPLLDMTPYEIACGLGGQCTTARFWCQTYLRGVTEQMWLGPDLLARLGGIDMLATVAEVTPIGGGIHVELKGEAKLDELEAALEPLLPGENDWQQRMTRLCRGK
jgi:hypothetical protein